MRDAFRELVSGWTLVHDVEVLGERIEEAGRWAATNAPLHDDEEATVKLMIRTQVAWGIMRGDFEPYIPRDTDPDDVLNFDLERGEKPQ
jgi:hypothetical protein